MKKLENVADIYPLTPLQQGMLYHTLSEPDSEVYFEQIRCNLSGSLDVSRFKAAWDYVIAHYPALRTAFIWEQINNPLQVIRKTASPPWEVYDWRDKQGEQTIALDDLALANRQQGFDLATAPLMRFDLVQLDKHTHHFIWNFHHLLLDGWSTHQVLYDAFKVYERLQNNQKPFLPPTKPFRNYIAWLKKQDLQKAETFWRHKLAGFAAPTPLNVDKSGFENNTVYGELAHKLSASTTTALQQFSQRHRLTLNTGIQGAWSLLLSRYSGQDDIVFGNTVSGRPAELPGVEKMVGMCINTLPARVQLQQDEQLIPWLQKLQSEQLEARQYQYTPLAQIQQWSEIAPGQALFDSIVVFENYPGHEADRHALRIENIEYRELSNYPLALLILPGEQIRFLVIYNRNRFDPETIERLLNHLQTILEAMVADPYRSLAAIPMLTPSEWDQLLVQWNDTTAALPAEEPIFRLVEKFAAQTPEARAVTAHDGSLTYQQLNERANQLAHCLLEQGVERGTAVCLYSERSWMMLVGIIGIQKAGCAYVPLDPAYPAERIEWVLQDSEAQVVVAQQKLASQLPATETNIIAVDDAWQNLSAYATTSPSVPVQANDLAYIIYTSGSTGTPKGVMVTHGNLFASTMARGVYYAAPVGSFLLLSSFAFDSSVVGLFWTLATGGTLVLPAPDEEKDVQQLATIIQREQVTHTLALPALYRLLLTYGPPASLNSLAVVIVAGEACPKDLGELHYNLLPQTQLHNEYGPTEATVWCSVYPIPPFIAGDVVPIGRPIANTQLYILDRHGQPAPIGVPGELYVGGVNITPGYWQDAQRTSERFPVLAFNGYPSVGRVYRTGDLARWRSDGQIDFLGRADNQIKIRGFRVELGEIETQLRRHPAVQECVVVVHDGGENGRSAPASLVAYIVGKPDAQTQLEVSQVQDHLGRRLPAYMVPNRIMLLPALPRLPNGKVDVRHLPQPTAAQQRPFVPAKSPAEEKLVAIWRDILRLPQISVDDRFVELGGDSILAIQAIARARQAGLYLTPRQLFVEQTIRRLAAVASVAEDVAADSEASTGLIPLTPIQHWFFEHVSAYRDHWNQATWFEVEPTIDRKRLRAAFAHLVQHHPMLRTRYLPEGDGWRQEILPETAPPELTTSMLSQLEPAAQDAAMLLEANKQQASLDLAKGQTLQATLFDLGAQRGLRLFVVLHHLVIDAVSWSMLTTDLQTAYQQLAAGEPVSLPVPQTSYATWARALVKQAKSERQKEELGYWQRMLEHAAALPTDFAGASENREGQAKEITAVLETNHTTALLRNVHQAYYTHIDDLLLTALVQTMTQWSQHPSLLLTWERYGREEINPRLDVSQTVGWFTSLTPLMLKLANSQDIGANLRAVKEQLRAVPQHGLGFGLLRYLGDDRDRSQMAQLPKPQILFNYLGQSLDVRQADSLLQPLDANIGQFYGAANERAHLIDVNAEVINGRLRVNWQYASDYYQTETIQTLATAYISELVKLIDHCLEVERSRHTPSDFPLAKLQQEELDSLSDLLAGLE
ncbi:MAG: amino acid adenylation domain-containing protein [Chloroflexota bacterium]